MYIFIRIFGQKMNSLTFFEYCLMQCNLVPENQIASAQPLKYSKGKFTGSQ